MLFWICCAVLAVGAVVALARPLMSVAAPGTTETAQAELAVYRDQLAEIETDKARGTLDESEAEAARAEVGRRMLAKARELEQKSQSPAKAAGFFREVVFYGVAAAVPTIALLLYLMLGSPSLPGQPFAERVNGKSIAAGHLDELIARVEEQLRKNPADGQGWEVLAPVYMRVERFREAADAYQRAIDILGESPRRLSGLAESTVLANNGVVTEPARKVYERWLALEPNRPEARFGLAVAKEQDGDKPGAEAAYRSMLADAPPGAPWRSVVQERLDALTGKPVSASPGSLPPEQLAMIMQMVEGLEAKLKANGNDPDGWQRLVQSWSVLGNKERAKAALLDARRALGSDSNGLDKVNALAKSLGLES